MSLRACAPRVASGRGGIGKGIIKRSKTPGVPGRGYCKTDRSYRKTGAIFGMVYGILPHLTKW